MLKEYPQISMILPVKNAERTLDKTFEYLLNVKYPRDKMEIIIADGESTDKTVEVINNWQKKYPFIKLVNVPKCPSPGYARNQALKVAKGKYILFTDGDCAPAEDWAEKLVEPFLRDPQIGGVGGEIFTLRIDPDSLAESYCEQIGFLRLMYRYSKMKGEGYMPALTDLSPSEVSGHNAPFFATANACYRKDVLDQVGGFWDEPTGEDVQIAVKTQMAGYKLYFVPSAQVKHMHRATPQNFFKVWVGYGKGHPVLVKKMSPKNMLEIAMQFANPSIPPSLKIPAPFKALIYLGNFQLLHVFLFLALLGLIVSLLTGGLLWPFSGWGWFTLITLVLGLYYGYKFFAPALNYQPRKHFFFWCWMRYATNWNFCKGALMYWGKTGVLYIEPSF